MNFKARTLQEYFIVFLLISLLDASSLIFGSSQTILDQRQRFNFYTQKDERYFDFPNSSSCSMDALQYSALICCNSAVAYYLTLSHFVDTQTEVAVSLNTTGSYSCQAAHLNTIDIYTIQKQEFVQILHISSAGLILDKIVNITETAVSELRIKDTTSFVFLYELSSLYLLKKFNYLTSQVSLLFSSTSQPQGLALYGSEYYLTFSTHNLTRFGQTETNELVLTTSLQTQTCAKYVAVSSIYIVLLCPNDYVQIRARQQPSSVLFYKYITGRNNNLYRPAKIYENYFGASQDVIITSQQAGAIYVLEAARNPHIINLFHFNYIYMKWYDALDVTLIPTKAQVAVIDPINDKIEFTHVCPRNQAKVNEVCTACGTDTYSPFIDSMTCSEPCSSSNKSLRHHYCNYQCSSGEYGKTCLDCASYRSSFDTQLASLEGLNSATCEVESSLCASGSHFSSDFKVCINTVPGYLEIENTAGYDSCLIRGNCESCKTHSSSCNYYAQASLCAADITGTGISETPSTCASFSACSTIQVPQDTNSTSQLLLIETGQQCEWLIIAANFQYFIELTRASDTNDTLSIEAYDKNNATITSYTGAIELGLDDWIKIIYTRTAANLTGNQGLTVTFVNITDPFYVPPVVEPPVVEPPVVEPPVVQPEPQPEPTTTSSDTSAVVIIAIVTPLILIIGLVIITLMLIRRCKKKRRRATQNNKLKNLELSQVRSFDFTKDQGEEVLPRPSNRSAFKCQPISEQDDEEGSSSQGLTIMQVQSEHYKEDHLIVPDLALPARKTTSPHQLTVQVFEEVQAQQQPVIVKTVEPKVSRKKTKKSSGSVSDRKHKRRAKVSTQEVSVTETRLTVGAWQIYNYDEE